MRSLHALGLALLASACTVGPRYERPAAPLPHATAYKAYKDWKLATPSDTLHRGRWWDVYREPELDGLEARLAEGNQTIKQAFETYQAARAQIRQAQAGYYPTLGVNPGVSSTRTTTGISGTGSRQFTTFTAPAEASWAPDLFGRVRNAVHQAQYGAQVSAADLESQRLLEQATLAQTYFQIRGQDALAEILAQTVDADAQILALSRSLFETGVGTEVAVVQAEQTLEIAQVAEESVTITRAQLEHAISTLIGTPATDFTLPHRAELRDRAELRAPPAIPTGAPSQLLERRPDIAAAERQMAQANATIGIGYAAFYPTLNLTASAGIAAGTLGVLFSAPAVVWSVGASISETVFDGGLRSATIAQYRAQYRATVAGYRQTVLTAFQQVEDDLAQLATLGQQLEQQKQVVALAERAFELEKTRYETGIDPYLNLMTQQTIVLSERESLVNIHTQAMTSSVALIEALGGGWQQKDLPAP